MNAMGRNFRIPSPAHIPNLNIMGKLNMEHDIIDTIEAKRPGTGTSVECQKMDGQIGFGIGLKFRSFRDIFSFPDSMQRSKLDFERIRPGQVIYSSPQYKGTFH